MATIADRDEGRENNFDFLRVALSLAVVYSHSFMFSAARGREVVDRLTNGQAVASTYAVCFFFAISGYLISSSWHRSRGAGDYLCRRVLRIQPGLAAAVAVSFLVVAPLGAADAGRYLSDPATYRALLLAVMAPVSPPQSFLANPEPGIVNGSLWTIPCEFLMYLLVAGLGLCGALRRPRAVLAAFVACWLAYRGVPRVAPWLSFAPVPYFGIVQVLLHLMTYFLAGVALRAFADRVPHSWLLFLACLAVLAACHRKFLNGVMPVAGVYALFFLAFVRVPRLSRFGRYGDFSYGLYLYAYPVGQLIVLRFPGVEPLPLFFWTSLAALPLAVASWHFVERPFLRRKPSPVAIPPPDDVPGLPHVAAK